MVLTAVDIAIIVGAITTPVGAAFGVAYYAGKKIGEICARLELLLTRTDGHEISLSDMTDRVRRIEAKLLGNNMPEKARRPYHNQTEGDPHYGS
jgi:hypothetical protein